MAEGVQPRLRLGPVLVERGEDDTGRAEHDRERPRRRNADAERSRRLVARARDLRRLVHRRQPLAGKLERVEQLVAPAPVGDVEEKRPGRIGDVDRVLAGEAVAHVVLRQEDVTDPGVRLGLVPAEPEELRRREAGERAISGQLEQPVEAEPLLDLGAFRAGALVVPEDRGPKHVTVLVEDDEAVHLAREAERAVVPELAERRLRSQPPVFGILFGPARSRCRERVGALGTGEHLAGRRERERLDAARPDVEPGERPHAWQPSDVFTELLSVRSQAAVSRGRLEVRSGSLASTTSPASGTASAQSRFTRHVSSPLLNASSPGGLSSHSNGSSAGRSASAER